MPMSQQLLDELNQGVKAMGLEIPGYVAEKLIDYIALLNHWNKAFNLTAIREPAEMVSKHLLDSLAVLPYLGKGCNVLDVGTGAGLPGIPLALCQPARRFVLNDCNGKKTRFLTQAKMVLGLDNVEVVNQRIEEYQPMIEGRRIYFDLVIARAYASTADILSSTAHLHSAGTRVLVMQGKLDETLKIPDYVLAQSHKYDVFGLDAERHLLEIVKK